MKEDNTASCCVLSVNPSAIKLEEIIVLGFSDSLHAPSQAVAEYHVVPEVKVAASP